MERMTSLELVRSDMLAELHPQCSRGEPSASTEVAPRQVVKERPPSPVVRSIDRGSAPMCRPVEAQE